MHVTRMVFQHPVIHRVAPRIERNTIDACVVFQPFEITGDAVGFDQHQIQFDRIPDFGVCRQYGKRFPVLTAAHPHGAEFGRKPNSIRPAHEFAFHFVVESLVA